MKQKIKSVSQGKNKLNTTLTKGKIDTLTAKTPVSKSKLFPHTYNYYTTDGNVEIIHSKEPLSLDKLQELVGGLIELVNLTPHSPKFPKRPEGRCVFINEEGWLKDFPENPHFDQDDVFVDLSHSNGHLLGNVIEGKNSLDGEFVGIDSPDCLHSETEHGQCIYCREQVFV